MNAMLTMPAEVMITAFGLPSRTRRLSLPGVEMSTPQNPMSMSSTPITAYSRIAPIPRPITEKNPGSIWASVTRTSRGASGFGDAVRDERGPVVGHQTDGLADAEPGRGIADDPGTQRGPETVELGERVEELVDVPLLAVHAARLVLHARCHDRDVGALTAEAGLADVLGEQARLVEVCR